MPNILYFEIAHALEATHKTTSAVNLSPENIWEQINILGKKSFHSNGIRNKTKFRNEKTLQTSCHWYEGNHLRNHVNSVIFSHFDSVSIEILSYYRRTSRHRFRIRTQGDKVKIGRIPVFVKLGQTIRKLNLYVMDEDYDPFFGREWIKNFVKKSIDLKHSHPPFKWFL